MAWNQPTSNNTAPRKEPKSSPSLTRGIVAGLVVVALAAVCFVVFMGKGEKPVVDKVEKKPTKLKEVKPAAAPKDRTGKAVAEVKDKKVGKEKYPGEKILTCTTNSSGYVMEVTVDKDGVQRRHVTEPRSPWDNAPDEMIALALCTPEGKTLPPWPNMGIGMDKVFLRACEKPIEIKPDDDEKIAAMKRIVMASREEIKSRIENGEHFCDILNDHRNLVNENGTIRANVVREFREIAASGDEAAMRQYMITMNAALSQLGIHGISEDDIKPKKHSPLMDKMKK